MNPPAAPLMSAPEPSPLCRRVLAAQLCAFQKAAGSEGHTGVVAAPDPATMMRWHCLAGALGDRFPGGEYYFTLDFPPDFPQRPPSIVFATPSGIFIPRTKVCISVGEFHVRSAPGADGAGCWRPALGAEGVVREVVNALRFFAPSDHGIGVDVRPPEVVAALAAASRAFNRGCGAPPELEELVAAAPEGAGRAIREAREAFAARQAAAPPPAAPPAAPPAGKALAGGKAAATGGKAAGGRT